MTSAPVPSDTNDEIPSPPAVSSFDDGGGDRARLRRQRDAAGARRHRREQRPRLHRRRGVDEAHRVGADHAHAVAGRAAATISRSASAVDDHEAGDALLRAVLDDAGEGGGRHGDDRDVHRAVDVDHPTACRSRPRSSPRSGSPRGAAPAKPCRASARRDLVADGARAPSGPHDRQRRGSSSRRIDRASARHRPRLHRRQRRLRRVDGHVDLDDAVGEPAADLEAGLARTPSIFRFDGSTWAMNPAIPTSRARAARYSSRTVARPRPLWASSMKNATSASLVLAYRS